MDMRIIALQAEDTAITYKAWTPQSMIKRLQTHANNLANSCLELHDQRREEALFIQRTQKY